MRLPMPLPGLAALATTAAVAAIVIASAVLAARGGESGRPLDAAAGAPEEGYGSLSAIALFGWPTPVPTPTPTPLPSPTPPPPPAPVDPPPAPPADVAAPPPAAPPAGAAMWYDGEFSAAVLSVVNAERAARGLGPLAADGVLMAEASSFARLQLDLDTLSHSADGLDLRTRVRSAGYSEGSNLGEVIWGGTGNYGPGDTVSGWLNSPSHYGIIMGGVYSEAGVGCWFRPAPAGFVEGRCVMTVAG